jgi:hypothetical protein
LAHEIDQEFRKERKEIGKKGGRLYSGNTQAEAEASKARIVEGERQRVRYAEESPRTQWDLQFAQRDLAEAEAYIAFPEGAVKAKATAVATARVEARRAELEAAALPKSKKKPMEGGGGGR